MTDLSVIKSYTTRENVLKMQLISEFHKRSVSRELAFLIEKHIKEFEKDNGEINVIIT